MEFLLEARNLKKSYQQGRTVVLRDVSLRVAKGEFVCVMGPSGSGKSTLMHILSSLDSADHGEVRIEGDEPQKMSDAELALFRRRRLGFVFQFFNLLPHLTAVENVALPALLDGQSLTQARGRATELLQMMGLGERMDHRPAQLSGGQMQRVAIARALYSRPALLMADEPTGNLDSQTGLEVLQLLKSLNREHQQTIIMVTHDPKSAEFASRLIRMSDGKIVSDLPAATSM